MRRAPLAAFLLGAGLATLVVSLFFLRARNLELRAAAFAEAEQAVAAIAAGQPARVVAGGVVGPPVRSLRHPFLKKRTLDGRPLGGPDAGEMDKLLADAAAALERDGDHRTVLLQDGLVVATAPAPRGVAVAVIAPPSPRPYPIVAVGGALLLGALAAAVFGLAGLGLGIAGLAVPASMWGGAPAVAAVLGIAALTTALEGRGLLAAAVASAQRHRVAYAYLAPAALGMGVLVAVPFAIGCVLGFYDHAQGEWRFVGLDNFAAILGGGGRPLSDPLNFWFTLAVTLAWTAVNVALHVGLGLTLALALHQPWLRGRGVLRVLLILPWAIPNYITALIWQGMFQRQYGAVNAVLGALGIEPVSWFSQFSTAFVANVATNTWLGFPFMMVVALGALSAIPRELYEAAAVDGAGPWARFRHVTLPSLLPALVPAVLLGSIWTFNMFNVIYLVSEGKPSGATDILVTQAYRWAFERGQRYGMAAAYATIIFVLLAGWTWLLARVARRRGAAA